MSYAAPIKEQLFAIEAAATEAAAICGLPVDLPDLEMAEAILTESGKLAAECFAPINALGDRIGARWNDGSVTLPDGFVQAFAQFRDAGWPSLTGPEAFGGQGMAFLTGGAVQEQFTAANMALSLCLMLGHGAVASLREFGSPELQAAYLPKLVSGEWTGTMNLTEPQAGSDVGALRTKAIAVDDGTYRIQGSKIFITFGEHDLAKNIIHLVLARLPEAPAGTRGISLFLVPKILPDGTRNDLRCVSIEHKMGIHASPTCTMSYGDEGRCIGWLVGAENQGMRAMFAMMNHARINVGLQGVAIAERATQAAVAYARERVQFGRIIDHADVRRMIMTMRAHTQAARAIAYTNAAAVDLAESGEDPAAQGLADLLTPLTKAYATDVGVEVTSLAIQIHGGMGFIEETGVAQHYRDARIAPIYEGTNGIQALDLVNRKLGQGHWEALFEHIARTPAGQSGPLADALAALRTATAFMLANAEARAAGATPYLRMFALVVGGHLLAQQADRAQSQQDGSGAVFRDAKIATADFYLVQLVPAVASLLPQVVADPQALFALGEEQLAT